MLYVFDTGSIRFRKNVLTWSIPGFFSLPLDEISEIRTSEFTFKGCKYTLAIWPRGYTGIGDWFGVCLYINGESRLGDFIEFGIVGADGNIHNCLIQRLTHKLYRNFEYLRLAKFQERREHFVPNGCLTMVCKMLSNDNSDLTTSTDDESYASLSDSREFVFIPQKFSVVCPNGDYNCPNLSSHLSSMKLTVPQGYGSLSSADFRLPFPPDFCSSSRLTDLSKEDKFCKKSAGTESHFRTNTGDNLKSKGNFRPDESNPPNHSKMSKNEFKHSRAQSDSKILIKDGKASDDYLVKTDGKYFPCYKQSKKPSCGKQKNVEISQPEDCIKSSKKVPSDDFDETTGSDINYNSHHNTSCPVQKCVEALQSEDDTNNSSFENLTGNQKTVYCSTPPPPYTAVYCLKNPEELDNHHMNGGFASCEDPEVSTEDCVDSSNINTVRIKKAVCSACFNSISQQPAERENSNNTKDDLSPAIPTVAEFLPSVQKEVIVFVQNENHTRTDAEGDNKEAVSTNSQQMKPDESSALASSSTDTEKVAAKECLLMAGTDGTTKDLENRNSLDGLKSLEIKMARLLREMKSLEILREDLKKSFLDGKHSDLTIKMGDHTFKVHKTILSSRSPVFKEMLSDNAVEIANNTITIDKNLCDPETFHDFLLYLYSAKYDNMSEANVFGMYRAAMEYGVPNLKDECIRYMKNSVGLETVCDIIHVAKKHNEAELMEVATAFFVRNVKDVLDTDKYKLFVREDPDTAIDLFKKSLGN